MVAITAFFYGTLMHPKVLQRVILNDGSHLEIAPAVLLEYTRHKVKSAEYPALVPYTKSHVLWDRELEREEKSVRGSLVKGLTAKDIELLDVFEGDEYIRVCLDVYTLGPFVNLAEYKSDDETLVPTNPPALPAPGELPTPIKADIYVFEGDINRLEPNLWSFGEFVKNNAAKWYGTQGDVDARWADKL